MSDKKQIKRKIESLFRLSTIYYEVTNTGFDGISDLRFAGKDSKVGQNRFQISLESLGDTSFVFDESYNKLVRISWWNYDNIENTVVGAKLKKLRKEFKFDTKLMFDLNIDCNKSDIIKI